MFRSVPLDDTHALDDFDSAQPDLDRWLRDHARGAEAKRTARTFVWLDGGGRVVGYYALAAHTLSRASLPRRLGRGDPAQVPAVLLAKLALHKDLQGRGLGAALLADALGRVLDATRAVAARYVVVDAIDDFAADFYAHHGFEQVAALDRLVRKISDLAEDR
ncbi:MAG TPA: GNAT family N-acetyltransferase [Mycobacteriales bacterium]